MSWLDKLLGRKRESKAPEQKKPPSEADILEEEVAEEREEVVVRGHVPPGVG
jgi:hypothetical protein